MNKNRYPFGLSFFCLLAPDDGGGAGGSSDGDQGGDSGSGQSNDMEFEEYNGMRVQKGTVDIINKRVGAETGNLKKKYSDLETRFNDVSAQLEELRRKGMTDEEKQKLDEQKRIEKEEALIKERDENFGLFKKHKIDTELFSAVSKYEVFNQKQVVKLVKSEFDDLDVVKGDEGYEVLFKKGLKTFTVEEAVKTFLEDETNANLLKSTLKSGGDTKQFSGGSGTGQKIKRADYEKLDPASQMEAIKNKVEIVD